MANSWQDAAKTIPVAANGDPIRVVEPEFGSGDTTAPNDAARPVIQNTAGDPDAVFDLVDDDLQVPVTTPGFLFIATKQGMYWGEYDFSVDQSIGFPDWNPIFPVVGWCAIDRVLTLAEIQGLKDYFAARGAVEALGSNAIDLMRAMAWTAVGDIDVSGVIVFRRSWEGNNLTSFPLLDVSSGADFQEAWRFNNLTSFPLLDVSSGTNFSETWRLNNLTSFPQVDVSNGELFSATWDDNSLTSFPYNILSGAPATSYGNAWRNNALDAESVDGILVTIRDNAVAQTLNNGILGLQGGTNAAPTNGAVTGLNGIQAKADLQGLGWTVNTN